MPADALINLDVAHQVLATFGITEPSPLYDRRVKPSGFAHDDLHEVLASESPFIFIVDWRAALPEELALIIPAVEKLGANVRSEVAVDADDGWIECAGKREWVKYVPNDNDDFTDVIVAFQTIIPAAIEFRESIHNGGSDTWEFAALLREEWTALESLDRAFIASTYRSLAARPRA
jgi:hypothetical protein